MKFQQKQNKCKNQDLWITSYADLVSAILAVLVLMVSFSKIDIEKYDMIQRLMIEKKEKQFEDFSTLKEIMIRLKNIAKNANIENKVSFDLNKDGLLINFDSAAQFQTGGYKLKPSSIKEMLPIFQAITKESQYRYIDISGYTDNVPGGKVTNWELSALRALSVQKKLEELGLNNKNVRLLANADNKPLIPYQNLTGMDLKNAQAKNRRVSVIIRDAKFSDLKQ